jgi:flagellar biosynthetic protein FliR
VNSLDGLIRAEIAVYLLECARVSGVIIVAPLGWFHAPVRVKVTLVLLLAFVAHGLSEHALAPASAFETGLSLCTEFMVGIGIGFIVRLVVSIAEICGDIISPAIGLGVATAFDPTTQSTQSVVSNILRHFIVLVALIIGVHRVVLGGLLEGFRLLPIGTAGKPGELLPMIVQLTSLAFAAGVRIALPLIAVLYMTQVALAFIARAAPQMQVFNVGFAVLLGVGLFLLAAILPDISRSFIIELSQVGPRLEETLGRLGAIP